MNLHDAATAAMLPSGQRATILDAKRKAARHPSDHAYANLKCRCVPCVTSWNTKMRARSRAVQRLINAHREEFDLYLVEERKMAGLFEVPA